MLRRLNQPFEIVAHHALENHFNAQLIDLLGEIERIRIRAEGRQQLRADRDDLGIHG
jgi:hypothetical protein